MRNVISSSLTRDSLKFRLDEILVQLKLAPSRSQAKLLIQEGKVLVNGQPITKASHSYETDAKITLTTNEQYVSRGAQKLAKAIERFKIDPKDKIIADVGASTGGFTDYLLQHGAKKVYAIDVGHSQLAPQLETDPRVVNMESTDIRTLKNLPEKIDFAVVDLSFISLRLTLPAIAKLTSTIITLFKPQFEAGPQLVPRDGVIKDPETIQLVLTEFEQWCTENHFQIEKNTPSPIKGKGGNQEILLLISSRK